MHTYAKCDKNVPSCSDLLTISLSGNKQTDALTNGFLLVTFCVRKRSQESASTQQNPENFQKFKVAKKDLFLSMNGWTDGFT